VVLEGIERARTQGTRLALAELLRLRGMVLARRQRWDEAEHAFEEAVSVARSIRYPYAQARALYEWGLMCVRRRDTEQSRTLLREATETFRKLGSRPYSDMAQNAMEETG
jgi:tetratricopeptide (TPR) repeat protein